MKNSLLNNSDKDVVTFFKLLEKAVEGLDSCRSQRREVLGGETYLTDKELSDRLRISRRTLQDYRSAGKIPYYLVCGKILYKESQIEKMIADGYKRPIGEYL